MELIFFFYPVNGLLLTLQAIFTRDFQSVFPFSVNSLTVTSAFKNDPGRLKNLEYLRISILP